MSFRTLKDKLKSSSFGESLQEKISSFRRHDSPEPVQQPPAAADIDDPAAAAAGSSHDWRGLRALGGSIHDKLSSLVRPLDGTSSASSSAESVAVAASAGSRDGEPIKFTKDDGGSIASVLSSPISIAKSFPDQPLPSPSANTTLPGLQATPISSSPAAAAALAAPAAAAAHAVASIEDADKEIYEQQLTQLQEQLVSAMIENENLTRLLQDKESGEVKKLLADLEYERERNAVLQKRLQNAGSRGGSGTGSSPSRLGSASTPSAGTLPGTLCDGGLLGRDSVFLVDGNVRERNTASDTSVDGPQQEQVQEQQQQRGAGGFVDRLVQYGRQKLWELLEDLGDTSEPPEILESPLAVKRLKANVTRFSAGVAPIFRGLSGIKMLLSWQYPMLTVVLFIIYMYVVWRGFLLQTAMLVVVVRLLLNYAEEKNIISPISFLPNNEEKEKKAVEKELGVGDKFNIVLHVATKVQNRLGDAADALEKTNNLLMWRQPELTKQIFIPLCGALLSTMTFSTDTLLFLLGTAFGIKLFIMDNLYSRYPRLRAKYDSSQILWNKLLTNVELEKHRTRKGIEQDCIPSSPSASSLRRNSAGASLDEPLAAEDAAFCDRFDLPYREAPLRQSPFKDGRHCLVFDKDAQLSIQSVLSSHAKVVLTQSFLCYERAGGERKMIPLAKITRLEKKKTFTFIPGGGMSLEIAVEGLEKPYIMAGLLNRDECYTCLMDWGAQHGLAYAAHHQSSSAVRDLQTVEMRLSALDAVDNDDGVSIDRAYEAFKLD